MDLQGRPQHISSEIQDLSKAVNVTLFWDEKSGGELVFQVVFGQADFNHFPIDYFRRLRNSMRREIFSAAGMGAGKGKIGRNKFPLPIP